MRGLRALLTMSCCLSLTAGLSSTAAEPETELVNIHSLSPAIVVNARYAGSENFMGRPVDGYLAANCLLTPQAAAALAEAQAEVEAFGLEIVVFDCYRPQRAVDHFMRWIADPGDTVNRQIYYPNVPKQRLVEEGYIAEKSGHSRGSTVDLSLRFSGGRLLDMGTPWDFLDPRSHTGDRSIQDQARANRLLLLSVMNRHGFTNYPAEWWHFTLENEPLPDVYLDLPVR